MIQRRFADFPSECSERLLSAHYTHRCALHEGRLSAKINYFATRSFGFAALTR